MKEEVIRQRYQVMKAEAVAWRLALQPVLEMQEMAKDKPFALAGVRWVIEEINRAWAHAQCHAEILGDIIEGVE